MKGACFLKVLFQWSYFSLAEQNPQLVWERVMLIMHVIRVMHAGLCVLKSTATIQSSAHENLSILQWYQPTLLLQANNYTLKAILHPIQMLLKLAFIINGYSIQNKNWRNWFTKQNKRSLPKICFLALECVWGRCAANSDLPLTLRVDSGGFPPVMTGDCGCCWHNYLI